MNEPDVTAAEPVRHSAEGGRRRIGGASRAEMERRWRLVRDRLRERDLDALVVQGYEEKIGGYVRWLTDVPPGYPRTIVFHAGDWMTSVEHGNQGQSRSLDGADPDRPGIGDVVTNWGLHGGHFTAGLAAQTTATVLRKRGYRRVGLANALGIPHGFVESLTSLTKGLVEFVDETDFLDRAKAAKSPEELLSVRETARIQDVVFGKLLEFIEPGMRDFEINAFLDYQLQLLGADRGVYIAVSAPIGEAGLFAYRSLQGRTIGRGDYMNVLLESNGPGGHWTELGRPIAFGRVTQDMRDAFEVCRLAQAETARLVATGADPASLFAAHNGFMVARGSEPERRIHAHGMGYDAVERPFIRSDETMMLPSSVNLAIHPVYASPSVFVSICDNYVLSDGVGTFVHDTPKQIFELG